jgi:hypothetical protein
MAYNGSGTYIRVTNWQADATAKVKIKSDRHDTQDDDFASALSNVLCKDGQSQPTSNIPMNGHILTGMGTPVVATDSATKGYVDGVKSFSTGLAISGADANGTLSFSSTTGVNGLSFTGADLGWFARLSTAAGPGTPPMPAATPNRLVLNDKPDASGTDVLTIDEAGRIFGNANLQLGGNIFYDGTAWRVKVAGYPALVSQIGSDGSVHWYSTAASTAAGAVATLVQTLLLDHAGNLTATARVTGNDVLSKGIVYANNGSTYLNTDGNINGSVYGGYLTNWVNSQALAYANQQVSKIRIRRASEGSIGASGSGAGTTKVPVGAMVTGMTTSSFSPVALFYMYLQSFDPVNGWVGASPDG